MVPAAPSRLGDSPTYIVIRVDLVDTLATLPLFQVFFEQPVQVEPDQFYTASVILDGSELSYFGQEGMTEVMAGCVTFQFQCSAESTNGTGVQGGQIPELVFYGPICSNRASNSEPSGESVAKDG